MENATGVQQLFFQHVKNGLPSHISLADEIAELLNISNDSAYRRIRGEKPMSFDEIRILCTHYKISLDQLFHLDTDTIIFSGKSINDKDFNFEIYLQNILRQLVYMNSFDHKEVLFLSKDIPIFHHFNFPELAAFKSFFWMKTILQYPSFSKSLFVADNFMESLKQTCGKIIDEYNKIPSQEIWNIESIHATIRQIEYYKDTKVFASAQDITNVYDCLQKTIDHIENQAEHGYKFSLTSQQPIKKASYKLYINEFILGDNTYLVTLNDSKIVFINHSVLNTITTKDVFFRNHIFDHFQNIIRKSTQISGVGEKERSRFFNTMREKIDISRRATNHY